jgi:hypothetical protein
MVAAFELHVARAVTLSFAPPLRLRETATRYTPPEL